MRAGQSHRSTSQQQIARRLIKPEEVLQGTILTPPPRIPCSRRLIKPEEVLQGLRYDEQIVLIQNAPPLRCGRAIYFRRPDKLMRVKGGTARGARS